MAETLFLRLPETGAATWGAFDATGRLVGGITQGALANARASVANRRCAVLVNGIDVLTSEADLPAASQARLRQIVPFSLEESVADDVEKLVFAIGGRLASGATQVAATAKDRLDAWLTQLRAAGIVPHIVCAETDGVPDIPATLVLLIEGDRIAGRKPGHSPFVFEGLALGQVLDIVLGLRSAEADIRHVRVFVDEAGRTRFRTELAALGEQFASAEVKVVREGGFPHLAATIAQRGGINLLQGAYAPKSNWLALAQPWRTAASLLAVVAVLALAVRAAEFLQLRRADAELTATVGALCERVVGEAGTSACQREVRQRLGANAGGATEDFLSTLAAIAAARDADMRIEALSYRNRAMDLQLLVPSVTALDALSREIEQTRRFAVEIEAANQTDAGTEGRVRIEGALQ